MKTYRGGLQLTIGMLVGAACVYLAVRGVDFARMLEALKQADVRTLGLAAALMLFSHYLRALRWRYLLAPIQTIGTGGLYSALMIGYAANTFVPAHLGEFLRAMVISKKRALPAAAALASIVIERIIDVVSLIAVMGLAVVLHPFPQWVVHGGYLMLAGACLLLAGLVLCRRYEPRTLALVRWLLKPIPPRIGARLDRAAASFIAGILPLKSAAHYTAAAGLSIAIWLCYAGVYYACLEAFDLVEAYRLGWSAGLVVLVFTTVSVVIPSTPGYVGTYHYFCQMSLALFGVSSAEALSYAVASHLIGVLPVTVAGLILAHVEGIAIFRAAQESRQVAKAGS